MRSFIVRVIVNGLALAIACWILTGLDISTAGNGIISIILGYLFIGLIFGLVNAFVKPIVSLLSLPITILTLGLFTVVINAGMLYLTSWISSYTTVKRPRVRMVIGSDRRLTIGLTKALTRPKIKPMKR